MDVFDLSDIIAYAVFTGFEFTALCAMTRVARGWPLQLIALGVLVGVDFLLEYWWRLGMFPLDAWVSVCFICNWGVIAALTLCLSRECIGRRIFLSLAFGAYAVCFAVVFHLLAYRNVFGLSDVLSGVLGLVAVAVMNLAFIFWILPWMPRESRVSSWRDPCIAVGAVFANMFACGLWPISAVTAPCQYCLAFALASLAAWVAFPMLCRSMREHLHNADVERRLEQLMAEVKVRRAAIDETRRLRHDMRFHRAQIAEYELSGQHDKVLAYLRQLDAEAMESPTDKLVWCGNETVNAVLSGCSRKAAAKGVELVITAEVEPSIPLPDVELVAVIANLVDNAIEASAKELDFQVGAGARKVACTLRQRDYSIGIMVANPVAVGFALAANGLPCEEPGVGMESVRRIVEKRKGMWAYGLHDGVLTCQVVLTFGE